MSVELRGVQGKRQAGCGHERPPASVAQWPSPPSHHREIMKGEWLAMPKHSLLPNLSCHGEAGSPSCGHPGHSHVGSSFAPSTAGHKLSLGRGPGEGPRAHTRGHHAKGWSLLSLPQQTRVLAASRIKTLNNVLILYIR